MWTRLSFSLSLYIYIYILNVKHVKIGSLFCKHLIFNVDPKNPSTHKCLFQQPHRQWLLFLIKIKYLGIPFQVYVHLTSDSEFRSMYQNHQDKYREHTLIQAKLTGMSVERGRLNIIWEPWTKILLDWRLDFTCRRCKQPHLKSKAIVSPRDDYVLQGWRRKTSQPV